MFMFFEVAGAWINLTFSSIAGKKIIDIVKSLMLFL